MLTVMDEGSPCCAPSLARAMHCQRSPGAVALAGSTGSVSPGWMTKLLPSSLAHA
jgi:hypothetical protein